MRKLVPLVRGAQRRDTMAMNDLLDALAPYVRRICAPIALDRADDAMQETLVVVFRRLDTLRDPDALLGWVRLVATREAVRVARHAGVELATDRLPERAAPATGELAPELRDQLERMDPAQRAVLVLRDLEGLSEAEVAKLLSVPPGTVKSRLHRARARFRRAWTT